MKSRPLALALLGSAFCSVAQDTPPAQRDPASPPPAAASAGKSTGETGGRKDPHVPDFNDPATMAALQGKVVITTEIDGKKETRIIDLKDAGGLEPLLLTERPPARTGIVTYLGVGTMELPREVSAQVPLPQETGLLIGAVAPGSPAAKAGLMESDVLGKLDDQILITTRQLAVLIANHREGDIVKLTYYRKGQMAVTNAVLGKHEAPSRATTPPLASITRHLLKVGPDGKITRDSAEMSPAEMEKILNQCPAYIRPEVEKALRASRPLPVPTPALPPGETPKTENPAVPR